MKFEGKYIIKLLVFAFLFKCNAQLPQEFVYLDEINPNIIVNLRYLNNINFVASAINGYKVNRAILTREAALALNKSLQIFDSIGYNVIVYDAYRPQKAVDHFMRWSQDPNASQAMKPYFYPYVNHSDVFDQGYVAEKSGHSRGSTVDMTIIPKDKKLKPIDPIMRNLTDGRTVTFLDDNSVDMGTSFDLFDLASNSETNLVNKTAQDARRRFIEIMNSTGFDNYPLEWWHFTLRNEPFPKTYFNFDVE